MRTVRLGPIELQPWPPRLWVLRRRIHHIWPALLWALTDLPDRKVWVRDLLSPRER